MNVPILRNTSHAEKQTDSGKHMSLLDTPLLKPTKKTIVLEGVYNQEFQGRLFFEWPGCLVFQGI